jgi:hypothetical protein
MPGHHRQPDHTAGTKTETHPLPGDQHRNQTFQTVEDGGSDTPRSPNRTGQISGANISRTDQTEVNPICTCQHLSERNRSQQVRASDE